MENQILEQAKKNVEKKKGFYWHFAVYIACGVFFFLMNMVTMREEPRLWFFFPLLPWGIGLLIHYFGVFGIPGTKILTDGWEAEQLEKEIDKLKSQSSDFEPGQLDLEDFQKQKQKTKSTRWNDGDLV